MAITLTQNLKLRVDDNLTPDSKYNLNRIDTLGSLYQVDTNSDANVRSKRNILIQPESSDIGGSGSGGTVSIGTVDSPVSSVNIFSDTFSLSGGFSLADTATGGTSSLNLKYKSDINGTVDTLSDRNLLFDLDGSDREVVFGGDFRLLDANLSLTLSADLNWTLPPDNGTSGQVLSTDGAGTLSWTSSSASAQQLAEDWISADGVIKTITHNFGTRNIMVQVLDNSDSYRTIEIPDIVRPNDNQIILTSSSIPSGTWTVLLQQII